MQVVAHSRPTTSAHCTSKVAPTATRKWQLARPKALYPDAGPGKGIELDFVRELRTEWLQSGSTRLTGLEAQQEELNQRILKGKPCISCIKNPATQMRYRLYFCMGDLVGSFHIFSPVMILLTQPWTSPTGKRVSYNVVVPSLPGFVLSSPPPENWTVDDTARIFDTLMTEVLGYSKYALHGTNWGTPFTPPSTQLPQEIEDNNITLSDAQKVTLQRYTDWSATGNGYSIEQTNKPNTIGLALYDSPVGQLAWIAENFKLWSDPRAGTPPSVLTNAAIIYIYAAILTSVSLYCLTDSFLSSVWIYLKNSNGFRTVYTKAPTDAPLLFSQYEYNSVFRPQEYVAKVGNQKGHYAGLDNPPALIENIREMEQYFD
ncbi:Alpha/Beta hydrolase protein [Mycena crocata]|nr:Alpha/Beta hydrolase protein [Mycena crocata]